MKSIFSLPVPELALPVCLLSKWSTPSSIRVFSTVGTFIMFPLKFSWSKHYQFFLKHLSWTHPHLLMPIATALVGTSMNTSLDFWKRPPTWYSCLQCVLQSTLRAARFFIPVPNWTDHGHLSVYSLVSHFFGLKLKFFNMALLC